MSDFSIQNIKPLAESQLNEGLYVVLLYVDKIPPHLGIIYNNTYFSLSIKGVELGVNIAPLIKLINKKKIKTLFYQVDKTGIIGIETVLKEKFEEKKVVTDKITCLYPIKAFFNAVFAVDVAMIHYIYELIPKLEEHQLIKKVYEKGIDTTVFTIKKYTIQEIINRIKTY